jgi:hypothetical protein
LRDPKAAAEIARMAEAMRGAFGLETAEQIAECDFIIGQVRAARMKAIAEAAAALAGAGADDEPAAGRRHEQGANEGGREDPGLRLDLGLAGIARLGHVLPGIERLERYERRALARRQRAIRALMGFPDGGLSSPGPQKAGS